MADTQITPKVWVKDGATAGQIAVVQAVVDALLAESGYHFDDGLDSRITYQFVPKTSAHLGQAGNLGTAWGDSPPGRTTYINDSLEAIEQIYTVGHEGAHHIERDKLANNYDHASLMALMEPQGTHWNKVKGELYEDAPNETFADAFPRIYMPLAITRPGGKQVNATTYQKHRKVPVANYGTYKSIVAAGSGATGSGGDLSIQVAAVAGDTSVFLTSVADLAIGEALLLDYAGVNPEAVTIKGLPAAGTQVFLAETLAYGHAVGALVKITSKPGPLPGEPVSDVIVADVANGGTLSHTFQNLPMGSQGWVKVRSKDGKEWGAFSEPLFVALGVKPEIAMLVANLVGDNPNDIEFTVAVVDTHSSNGQIQSYSVQVGQAAAGGIAARMVRADVPVAGAVTVVTFRFEATEGTSLVWDQPYFAYVSVVNKWGLRSPIRALTFMPERDSGAIIKLDGEVVSEKVKIDTLAPTFDLYPATGGAVEAGWLYIRSKDGTQLIWDEEVELVGSDDHVPVVVDPAYLALGLDVQLTAKVRHLAATDYGPVSKPITAHFDIAPGAPAPVTLYDPVEQVVLRPDGVWVTTTDTPTFVFPYRDADRDLGFIDDPTRREVELRTLADAHIGASPFVIVADITDEWKPPAGLLPAHTQVKARADFDDSAGVRSAFSDYTFVEYFPPDSLTDVFPAPGEVLTDPTPIFSWVFGGDQVAVRLRLDIEGDLLFDSLYVVTPYAQLRVPQPYLDTGMDVHYDLRVYNADGIYSKATGTFTTAFTVPDALANLVVTPDPDREAFVVSYDASEDDVFEAYIIRVKTGGGQWRVARTITDIDLTTVIVYAVAHNVETQVRVSQTNGWAESDPLEGSAMLGSDDPVSEDFIDSAQLVRPEIVVQLPHPVIGEGDTQTKVEVYSPPLSDEKVLLNRGTTGFEVSVSLFTDDHDLLELLREWKRLGVVSIYKTFYGDVRYVRILNSPETPKVAGWFSGRIDLVEVAADSVDW